MLAADAQMLDNILRVIPRGSLLVVVAGSPRQQLSTLADGEFKGYAGETQGKEWL